MKKTHFKCNGVKCYLMTVTTVVKTTVVKITKKGRGEVKTNRTN